jgi:two-component system, OmpR family, alkaline phosphatase synthesis response regulator PhoP
VDDEHELVEMIGLRLEKMGYEVISSPDGESGLDKIKSTEPDLVLLDLLLPGIDGWEVARRIRANPKTAKTPIAIITASRQEASEKKAFDVGAIRIIEKPFDYQDILEVVEKL